MQKLSCGVEEVVARLGRLPSPAGASAACRDASAGPAAIAGGAAAALASGALWGVISALHRLVCIRVGKGGQEESSLRSKSRGSASFCTLAPGESFLYRNTCASELNSLRRGSSRPVVPGKHTDTVSRASRSEIDHQTTLAKMAAVHTNRRCAKKKTQSGFCAGELEKNCPTQRSATKAPQCRRRLPVVPLDHTKLSEVQKDAIDVPNPRLTRVSWQTMCLYFYCFFEGRSS